MGDAGIVDEDRDGAERRLDRVKRADHGGVIEHVCRDGDRAAARRLDAGLDRGDAIRASRHETDRRAVCGKHLGEAHAEPAGRAGHQRDTPGKVEYLRGFHLHCIVRATSWW